VSKSFKKIAKIALPVALSLAAPGIGTALGSTLSAGTLGAIGGGVGGLASGGGLKGTALGALGGGLANGGFGAVNLPNVGPTLSGAPLSGFGGGSGILGSLTKGGGTLANIIRGGSSVAGQIGTGVKSLLGTTAGTPLGGGFQGPTKGSGVLGFLTRGADALGGISGLGKGLTTANALSGLLSQGQLASGIDSATNAQQTGINNANSRLSPFVNTGTASNNALGSLLGLDGSNQQDIIDKLRQTPGFKFREQQGQLALDRSLGARGKLFSGAALKEAQRFGQGLANQTFNNRLRNLQSQSTQGLNAAKASGVFDVAGGNSFGRRKVAKANNRATLLANLFSPRQRLF